MSLVVSLLTLFAMIRIWIRRVLEPARGRDPPRAPSRRIGAAVRCSWSAPPRYSSPAAWRVAAAAGPIYALSERTADELLDRDGYIDKVLGP